MDRRTFLKILASGSVGFATGCSPDPYGGSRPDKTLYSLVNAPEDMVTGAPTWYATTCRECPAGCGILAKNREGRVIKLEGNPLHPVNRGSLCMRGQAALQGVYHPDRLQTPMVKEGNKWRKISFAEAQRLLNGRLAAAAQGGRDGIAMVTETVGQTQMDLFRLCLDAWKASPPIIFEPFAYESLKGANEAVFGWRVLPSYRMESADLLVAFGADFLETWLSPVEYARRFKSMHSINDKGEKGFFCHVSPFQSLTGANADLWLACHPGTESVVALGLLREALAAGLGSGLPRPFLAELEILAPPFTRELVAERAGIAPGDYARLIEALVRSRRPLVLGTGAAAADASAVLTDMAANCLNWVLDPALSRLDFAHPHRVQTASTRWQVLEFFRSMKDTAPQVLLLHNVNPVYAMPGVESVEAAITNERTFTVSFSCFLDETSQLADLVFPVRLPLECWDEYAGKEGLPSTLQPAMGRLTEAPQLGDVLLAAYGGTDLKEGKAKAFLVSRFLNQGIVKDEGEWLRTLQQGGVFRERDLGAANSRSPVPQPDPSRLTPLRQIPEVDRSGFTFVAAPSVRFFDGRGANRPWLCEIPDPLTRVAWQTPVLLHPATMKAEALQQGNRVRISHAGKMIEAPIYDAPWVKPGVLVMPMGQGHFAYGRYAKDKGINPLALLPAGAEKAGDGPVHVISGVFLRRTGSREPLARTDGARIPYGRKIALSVPLDGLEELKQPRLPGLTMWDFPMTLPLPEGYDPTRDFYPPHGHDRYRWSMVVDLDRCIGCGACAAACYAENNIGIVGEEQVRRGREMAWLSVERYLDPVDASRVTFLPLMCQHCDNAPCESVCPVYAPHHGKEGMNNQIYNRCIGTRFCSQNCPYKVRRFNWFAWEWPEPLQLQLNPNVTVRSKGVMEKCSFCIQRIKEVHGRAENEKRPIRDGEAVPACVQTCPTGALTFGSLMDPESRVRRLVDDPRAYQILGYLNTKPAVIYLRKVIQRL